MRALFDSPAGIILLLLVIVLFGARRLPEAAKSVGKSIKIFKSELESDKSKNEADSNTSSDKN
ncbi:MAG: twin-arginine translocase TatA/TatE family subunit [Candidatus Nanopelagicales bacterium]|nr:twin-arginine translocase TatA/TatE family subunit [Candidatus Nanopelagicales bacterium]